MIRILEFTNTVCRPVIFSACESGTFGPGCQQRCHCDGGALCDARGICPKMRCAKGWLGNTCQTRKICFFDKFIVHALYVPPISMTK